MQWSIPAAIAMRAGPQRRLKDGIKMALTEKGRLLTRSCCTNSTGLRPNDILVDSLGIGLEPTNILTFLKKFGGTWCALPC